MATSSTQAEKEYAQQAIDFVAQKSGFVEERLMFMDFDDDNEGRKRQMAKEHANSSSSSSSSYGEEGGGGVSGRGLLKTRRA